MDNENIHVIKHIRCKFCGKKHNLKNKLSNEKSRFRY